jgi:hypothetical protein
MTEYSLSLFTIESDLKPIYAFPAKWQKTAEMFVRSEQTRTTFRAATSDGKPLCDNYSILRFRLSNANERAIYQEKKAIRPTEELNGVFLVDID